MPRTNKHYVTFRRSTRDKLEALYNARIPVKRIAAELGYTETSIYRELKRGFYMHTNSDLTETRKYSAEKAQRSADLNATAKGAPIKLGKDRAFARFVEDMILKHHYSPSAILDYIKENNLEFDTNVCRVTLYNWIDAGVFLNVTNKNLLRKGKMKKKQRKVKPVKQLPRENSIEKRPKEISKRNTFGHWELDSVIGTVKKGETLLVLTERLTRMELIFKSRDKSAVSTVLMINRLERKLGSKNFRRIFRSVTCDNGTEFSNTIGMELSPYTGKKRTSIYYCHPYCSSERGSNENQNAFIRRFIPKGTSISQYSSAYIEKVQDYINDYPRRIFDGQNSTKRFLSELDKLNIKIFLEKIHSTT